MFQRSGFQNDAFAHDGILVPIEVVPDTVPGGTSKRDKLRKRPRYHWESAEPIVPVVPEVLDAATGQVIEQDRNEIQAVEIEGLTAKIQADAREKLDEMVRRKNRRRKLAALLAALADEDE
jgi:hypothetical protein